MEDVAGWLAWVTPSRKRINPGLRQIQLHETLKTLGEFTVPVKLHKEVTAHLKVVIEKEAVAE
jgi:large subunit ribosomal protein L9